MERLKGSVVFDGASEIAPSAAHVIYDYYKENAHYADKLNNFEELIEIDGIVDSARFTREDILNPTGWVMLAFIADPRTGLGRKHDFRISNIELMRQLPELLRKKSADEILEMTDFRERVDAYRTETDNFKELLGKIARVSGDAIVLDIRGITDIPVGNRFIEYVLYPQQNISIRTTDGKDNQFAMISVGHSIFNRSSKVNVGSLVLKYGGGGHKRAGTCQVKYDDADTIMGEMLDRINANFPNYSKKKLGAVSK